MRRLPAIYQRPETAKDAGKHAPGGRFAAAHVYASGYATNLAGLAHVSLPGQTRRDLLPTSIAASDLWVTNS